MRETSVVEVDGVALRKMVFAVRDRLLNGTYVRMGAKNPKIKKLLPNGETVGQWIGPKVEEAYQLGHVPKLLPMLPEPRPEK